MRVTLNGKETYLEGVMTVGDLIRWSELKTTLVAVELNGDIVRKDEFETIEITEGDRIEVVHFVGGGD